ncbi:aspartate carbamoyltransferase [Neisseriaceae bacterium PsAf]|nr:aspartate carbamoyltransferase [Neisseriaceae bacterium PsAf]MCV2503624.1 aspartate carbamoyltransferase [Neisseriaceae bacterium]
MSNPLYQKNIISIPELSRDELELLIQTGLNLKHSPRNDLLNGKVIASCFFEPSTRTRLSFETAIQRLGGKVIGFSDAQNTSVKKGETLADTARMINAYADAIVMRHNKDGAARIVGEFANCPVINAGDGTNQHPSQTLLDLISIKETQGTLENLKIALVGDLKYGRTVHSLVQALSLFNCEFYFLSPSNLAMPEYICEELDNANITYQTCQSLADVIKVVDILYMTRIQKERFDEQEFLKLKNSYILNASLLNEAKSNLKILHPLPRVDEIHYSVDSTPYAYYFQQAGNGVFARQAILALVLNPSIS